MIQKFEQFINESESTDAWYFNLPFDWKRYKEPTGKFPKKCLHNY